MKHIDITYQNVPRETFSETDKLIDKNHDQLSRYLDRLLWWNKRINLVSRDVSRGTIFEHIRHSLLVSSLQSYKKSSLIVDSGTGGGLPGLPLSIVSPEKKFILNDKVTKKVMAIKQMAKTLGLSNISAADFSIEKATIDTPFLLITKHAFKINDLLRLTSSLPWTEIIFYKGIDFEEELEDIDASLSITVHQLYEASNESFYKDKALLVISEK